MPHYSYERLNDRSAGYLADEHARRFSHAASIQIFDAGPLGTKDGGVDFATIRQAIEARLHRVPRLRQELRWIPFEKHPVWVDDPDFILDYHLRHTSLPRPGGFRQLQTMAARIMAQRLDRSRPLWECWVLEGMRGGRFALIVKTHHCMVEEGGADLMQALLSAEADAPDPEPPTYIPRPLPSARELVMDEVIQRAAIPRRTLSRVTRFLKSPEDFSYHLEMRARRAASLLGYTVRAPMETPLNGPIGRHRRFRGLAFSLDEARDVRRRLGGTVHDVILAVVAGATRNYLLERLVSPASVDFLVATPVGVAQENWEEQVAEWAIDLPVWEKDPIRCFEQIRAATDELSRSQDALPATALVKGTTWYGGRLLSAGARAQASHTPVNMMITNSPGSQAPLYMKGARMLEAYGEAPLRDNHGLSIAVMSYDGRLFFGLNADFDVMRGLDRYVLALRNSFAALVEAASLRPVTGLEEDPPSEAEAGEDAASAGEV
jgi:WS/DGAT/MGAT family acyltransferase